MSALSFSRVLLVEDEPQLAQALGVALSKLGLRATRAATLEKARAALAVEFPELVLLDRMLPDGDGIQLLHEIAQARSARLEGDDPMVLILSAQDSTQDRVDGLNAGADDYLPKPFSFQELEARIHALSRRRARTSIESHAIDSIARVWRLDPSNLRVTGPSGAKTLTPLEFKFIQKLVESEGQIVSREALLKEVWGFSLLPRTRTVDQFLARMRRYFEIDAEKPRHFLTHRGAGYVFKR